MVYIYIYICIYIELQIKYWDQRYDVKVFLQYMFMALTRMGRRISGHRRARWYSRLLDLCKAGARNEATNYLLIYFYNTFQYVDIFEEFKSGYNLEQMEDWTEELKVMWTIDRRGGLFGQKDMYGAMVQLGYLPEYVPLSHV